MENLQQLECGSVCAGIGGFDLGFERAGIKTAWQIEFDDKANGILARHFPGANRSVRDLTDPKRAALKTVDVICGGTPCQGFSVAGLRGSMEDDRSNLCLQFVKLIYEHNPRIIVWENVPGVLSTKDNAFGVFLAGLVGASSALVPPKSIKRWRQNDEDGTEYFSWPNAGVVVGPKRTVAWRVLDTQFFGAPQRRERVFLVGDTLGGCSPEILFERNSLRGNYQASGETREGIAAALTASLGTGGACVDEARGNHIVECINGRPRTVGALTTPAPTPAPDGQDAYTGHLIPAKKSVTASSVTAKWAKGTGGPAGDECQNVVVVPIQEIGKRQSGTAMNGTGHGKPGDPMYTLQSSAVHGVAIGNAKPVAGRQREGKDGGGKGPLVSEDKSLTLGTANDQVIFDTAKPTAVGIQGSDTAFARSANGSHSGDKGDGGINTSFAIQQTGVRRLTPVECERLQGFPDNWTDGQADGNRYRQLGNAVSVPVAEWIGRRIVKALQKQK